MTTRLPPEMLASIFVVYVADVRDEYEQFVDYVRPILKFHPVGHTPLTDTTNVLRAKALERWDARTSPWSWLKLVHVCRKWRDAAFDCPRLWTWIVPELALPPTSARRALDFHTFIEGCISRSGNLPLTIVDRHRPERSRAGSGQLAVVFEQILAQFARIQSASFNVTSVNLDLLEAPSPPFDSTLLRELKLDMRGLEVDTPLPGLTFALLPALKILTLDGGTLELLIALGSPTLTSLTCRSPRHTVPHSQLLRLLQMVPSLRRLELSDVVNDLPATDVLQGFANPTMPAVPLVVSFPHAQEIHLAHTNLDGRRREELGLALLHLLRCLEFPPSAAIFYDPPANTRELNVIHAEFVASTVSQKVCGKPDFVARAILLDGESGHRYLRFWGSNQSLDALMTCTWTEPARLSFGLWGMTHFETAAPEFFSWAEVEDVTTVYISMRLDWTSWLILAQLPNTKEVCISGDTVSGALQGLVCCRTDDPDYFGREVLDEIAAYRENDDEEEEEPDDLAGGVEDEMVEPEENFIFPKLDTLVIRHMDASAETWNNGQQMDLLTYMIGALRHRKNLKLGVRLLRLIEISHFSAEHFARLQESEVVDVVEWDGKVMDSKGYKLYDTEYVSSDAYLG